MSHHDAQRCWARSVCAWTMSLTECVFDASLPNSNSAAALCPRHPPLHTYLTRVRWPHTSMSSPPCPLSQSRPTATPPHAPTLSTTTRPCCQQCDMSHRHHRGDVAHRRRRFIPSPVACHPHCALPHAAAAPMCHHYRPHCRPLPSRCCCRCHLCPIAAPL